MTDKIWDVLVVGGGLVGLASATALANAGLKTLHLAPEATPDRRSSTLMMPVVDFLVETDLIADPAALGVPLSEIRLIDATTRLLRAPEILFRGAEVERDAFGWNFPNAALLDAFAKAMPPNLTRRVAKLIDFDAGADSVSARIDSGELLTARLLVGADGKNSLVRERGGFVKHERHFTEAALVADLELERPLGSTSIEFHYDRGPFTLVPAGETRANLVWIDAKPALEQAARADDLPARIGDKSRHLFGRISLTSRPHIFGLSTLTVESAGRGPLVLIGEAAHAFAPIGAQGLNLGLRDVADLVQAVAAGGNVGDDYAHRRAGDIARTSAAVDALFGSLLSDFLPTQMLRVGTIWAMKAFPRLRQAAITFGMGLD